jgi:hypothetical protein
MNHVDDFVGWSALQPIGEPDTEAEQVAFGRRNLDSRNDQETVYRMAVFSQESLVTEVAATIGGVVVCEGDAVESSVFCGGNEGLGAAHPISGKKGVNVRVNSESHRCTVVEIDVCGKAGNAERFSCIPLFWGF